METEHVHTFAARGEPSPSKKYPGIVFMLLIFLGAGAGLMACGAFSPAPQASGAPVNLNGNAGTTFTDRTTLPSPYSKITLTYQGQHNFIVTAHFEDNDGIRRQDTLVNAIGDYHGTTFVASRRPVLFEIVSDDGTWEGIIEGVGKTDATFWSGRGDWVSDFFDVPAEREWVITHNGTNNFMVRAFCLKSSEQWVLSEIGPYSGTIGVEFGGSPCAWIVNADGDWSIALKQ